VRPFESAGGACDALWTMQEIAARIEAGVRNPSAPYRKQERAL